jgi:uncharacterized protein (TIGR01777 family)
MDFDSADELLGRCAMRVLVSGSSGLIGSTVVASLAGKGHEVLRLSRSPARTPGTILWDPGTGILEASSLEGIDVAIHLAGENIAGRRWTAAQKRRILESRTNGTRLLADRLSRLTSPPEVLISASAIGYYGNRGDEILREGSPAGSGFLAETCRQWEQAAHAAITRGIRVVFPRIGMVLSQDGGALPKMLPPFRVGLGGPIGRGNQFMSWISLDDLVGALIHCMQTPTLSGPVNAVAPSPRRNLEFTRALGRALSRPAFLPVPAWMMRLMLGEMADELLLASTRVEPVKLVASGYQFRHPDLEGALRHALGRDQGAAQK